MTTTSKATAAPAAFLIELVMKRGDTVALPFDQHPDMKAVAKLLVTELFQSLSIVDVVNNERPFFISGPTIAEFGRLWLERNRE